MIASGKKILILGSIEGEIPLVRACKELGAFVIVTGREKDAPCCRLADRSYFVDIMDRAKLLEIANKEGIDAVASAEVERAVLLTAWLAEKKNLPGIGVETAEKFTNKFRMRQAARALGVGVPRFCSARRLEEALAFAESVGFPLVMKPEDNGGSKGVVKLNNAEELRARFEESRSMTVNSDAVILEEFIEGREYVVEAFTENGVPENLIIGHRDYFRVKNRFIPSASVFVDAEIADSEVERDVLETNRKLVHGFGLKFGITHGEFLYDDRRQMTFLVEITARGGGVGIGSDLIPLASGIDANRRLARAALGLAPEPVGERKHRAAAYFCFMTPQGVVSEISGRREAEAIPGVYSVFGEEFEIGKEVASPVDKASRRGGILVSAKTKAECYDIFRRVKEVYHVGITSGGQTRGIVWDQTEDFFR